MQFKLHSKFKPAGGQPEAIKKIAENLKKNTKQTLLGITGSGKTFCMANVIQKAKMPTLVLAHNKTLAAQLYQELKELFPENRVEYFISYYDYYQPESYIPTSDTYIEKEATVNKQIEKMRLKTMSSLLSREDVIVVASISCIYGAGNPNDFKNLSIELKVGNTINRDDLMLTLVSMLYERSLVLESGKFRVRGDTIDIYPAYDDQIIRLELFGDDIDRISILHPVTGEIITQIDTIKLFPAKQFVVPESKQENAIQLMLAELKERLPQLEPLEAERLKKRVNYDIEMIQEVGYCSGIENYSRLFDGRSVGAAPYCLLDYFPKDFLLIIDESHQSLPQSRAMYKGDFSRKKNLIDFGFRLPSAYDNRPLKFEEFEKYFRHTLFVSATPGPYELENSTNIVELIIRPTGLLDPTVEIRPIEGQIADIVKEIHLTIKNNERVLITTLTKRQAEDLTDYLAKKEIKVRYMHSDVDTLDRIELIRQLRAGEFDVLVGINLLREGLDLPEVSLVCILDADKQGFLRNERSFIQIIGRAARNTNGHVIMYAEKHTDSMKSAIEITMKRRQVQIEYNKIHNISPKTIIKTIQEKTREIKGTKHMSISQLQNKITQIDADMKKAANNLDFEKAIDLRDHLEDMKRSQEYRNRE
jgi:excinuclease ABC subunit B